MNRALINANTLLSSGRKLEKHFHWLMKTLAGINIAWIFSLMVGELIFRDECFIIVGLCMKVHRTLGKGFKEAVYKDALEIELQKAKIPYEREKKFKIEYDDHILHHTFDADFLVYKSIILEIKSASMIHADAFRQTLNYLKSSRVELAILINFGTDKLLFQRIINT